MRKDILILTVGLPHSGKSTWAIQQGFPIVNPDSIRLALHGQAYIQEAEGFVWQIAYLMARALFIAGHETVIIDATNISEKRRNQWAGRFPNARVVLEKFNTSKEECIERAKKNNRPDLIPIIEKMAANIEPNDAHLKVDIDYGTGHNNPDNQ